jgi:hypothetical protein
MYHRSARVHRALNLNHIDTASQLLYGGRLTVVSPLEERCSWRRANSGGGGATLGRGRRLDEHQDPKGRPSPQRTLDARLWRRSALCHVPAST